MLSGKNYLFSYSLKQKILDAKEQTLYSYFRKFAKKSAINGRQAIITNTGNNQLKTLTYHDLLNRVDDLANQLARLQLPKGKHLALLLPSGLNWIISILAASKLGIGVVCLKTNSAAYLIESLKNTNTAALILDEKYFDLANSVQLAAHFKGDILVLDHKEEFTKLKLRVRKSSDLLSIADIAGYVALNNEEYPDLNVAATPYAAHDILWLSFSSGTTGMPKAIKLSNENVVKNAIIVGHKMKYNHFTADGFGHRVFSLFPYFPAGGMIVGIFAALFNGACVVCADAIVDENGVLSPERAIRMLAHSKASILLGPPPLLASLIDCPKRLALPNLEMAMVGSTWCNNHLFNRLKNELRGDGKSIHMMVTYGQTEAGVITHVGHMPNKDVCEYPKYILPVGKPLPGIDIKIVEFNPKGRPYLNKPVEDGRRGMLLIKGYSVMDGYYHNLKKSKQTLICDQNEVWLKTNDVFIKKGRNYIYQGRCNDFLPCSEHSSHRILPVDVEPFILHVAHKLHLPVYHVQVVSLHNGHTNQLIACLKGHDLSSKQMSALQKGVQKKLHSTLSATPGLYYRMMYDYPLNASSKIDRMAIQKLLEKEVSSETQQILGTIA